MEEAWPNPIAVLSKMLAYPSRLSAAGWTVPGFYDSVKPIPDDLRREWARLNNGRRIRCAKTRLRARRRTRIQHARTPLASPDASIQRHHRRLPGRRLQHDRPQRREREGHLPACARVKIPMRSNTTIQKHLAFRSRPARREGRIHPATRRLQNPIRSTKITPHLGLARMIFQGRVRH